MIFDYSYPGSPQLGFNFTWSGGDASVPPATSGNPWHRIGLPLTSGMGI